MVPLPHKPFAFNTLSSNDVLLMNWEVNSLRSRIGLIDRCCRVISSTNIKAYNIHTYSLTGLLTGKIPKPGKIKGVWPDVHVHKQDLDIETDLGCATLKRELAKRSADFLLRDVNFLLFQTRVAGKLGSSPKLFPKNLLCGILYVFGEKPSYTDYQSNNSTFVRREHGGKIKD